jgi:hypothetical protein
MTQRRVELAARAASVVAIAGLVALVMIILFFGGLGEPFGTLNDISLLVMTLALAPVMVGYDTLGGRMPRVPATLWLVIGLGAVIVWCFVQALLVAHVVTFDYDQPATGAFAVEAVAIGVIGAWLAGASLFAGPWLTQRVRWLGLISGLGIVVFGLGLLIGGAYHPLTFLGGLPYQVFLPTWAFLLNRVLQAQSPVGGA